MAQDVAAEKRSVDSRRLGMLDDDMAHSRRCGKRTEGHLHPHEDVLRRRIWRACVTKITRQYLGNRRQQWQREGNPGLRAQNLDRAGAPVDILQSQAGHFGCAEAVGAHHQQQSMVTQPKAR